MTTAKLNVVRGRDGTHLGYLEPKVDMMTTRGEIVRVTPKGYTTQSESGTEYRYVKGTIGIAASITLTEARKWGFGR